MLSNEIHQRDNKLKTTLKTTIHQHNDIKHKQQ